MTPSEFNDRFDYDPDNDLLGEGGFGKIFKAWDNVRNEFIALKMSRVQPDMEAYSLLAEFERVKHLEHPNIARYMDCQRIKLPGIGTHDIALMKHYEYGNLTQLLQQHTLSNTQKHKLIEGLLEGIAYLHKLKPLIIHSDLKPSNILVVERRGLFIPLITDFGISRQAKVDDKSYVTNLNGAGTYAYAAPEQWEAAELRPNADLWSFGILLIYIWFNGKKLPFRSDDISIATESGRIEYMKRVIALDFIPDLQQLPEDYRRMVDVCLVVDPQKRVRSVEGLHLTNQKTTSEETVLLKKNERIDPVLLPMQEKTQIMTPDVAEKPAPVTQKPIVDEAPQIIAPPRSSRKWLIAGSGALAAALVGIGLHQYGTQRPQAFPRADSVAMHAVAAVPAKEIEKPALEIPVKKPDIAKKKQVPVKSAPAEPRPEPDAVYHVVEQYPSFVGGEQGMRHWLEANLRMPEAAERSFISGDVKLSFTVNADGSRQDIEVVKKLTPECDEEAIRLVRHMPKWKPGRTAGWAVRVKYNLAIPFGK